MKKNKEDTLKRWQSARFGLFVHWGLYSAGRLDCWRMYDMGEPIDEYIHNLEPKFNGQHFNPNELVQLALQAGCRYMVMGARHHEGYCLWNTGTTKFSSVRMTPGRDFIAEFVKAARKAGLLVGIYYSLLDWRHKAYWHGPRQNPKKWKRFVDYIHRQVEELVTQYGRIDILWFDGAWRSEAAGKISNTWGWDSTPTREEYIKAWRSKELNAMIRRHQPSILINNRSHLPGDFGTPEKIIAHENRLWELCDTIGYYWGYSPVDKDRKSVRHLVQRLVYCIAHNGNLLLNVRLKPNGTVVDWQMTRLLGVGKWLKRHQKSIYGCTGEKCNPFNNDLAPWSTTRRDNTLYMPFKVSRYEV